MTTTTTTRTKNEKLQRDLMRAIAVRALMNASGENCFCPVKKPTKFIVTLKPVVKVPNADPFLNIQPKFSACTCNTKSSKETILTPEQIQVRKNTEALKGKTLLNAFRVLTNSKFISIDPEYSYGASGILSPSCDKLRLSGGGKGKCNKNENVMEQAGEPATNQKACECQNQDVRPTPERVTFSEGAKVHQAKRSKERVKFSESDEKICKPERKYHIYQRNCYDNTSGKQPRECHIVLRAGEYAEKEPKKKRQKPPKKECEPKVRIEKTAKERAELRRELAQQVDSPTCVEKAVGTSDYPCTTESEQEAQPEGTLNTSSWDPLKYFGLCDVEEKIKENAKCALRMFPYPAIRRTDSSAVETDNTCQTVAEPQQPIRDTGKGQCQPISFNTETYKDLALVAQPPPCPKEVHYEPKPRPPDVSSEIIAQQCQRIHKLEQHVNEMSCELRRMKTEIIPPDDMLRCTALTSKLRELTELLADLKNRHAEAIATVIMAQKQQAKQAAELTIGTRSQAVSPTCGTRTVSPERAAPPTRAVSPERAAPPTRAVSPTRALSPVHVGQNKRPISHTLVVPSSCTTCSSHTKLAPAPPPQRHPETRAEQVQTCFADSYKDQLSQTNASFGWRPFVDEATQSSPPSTVRVTPKNTSSAPLSSHTSSAASVALPCRHNTGEIPLKESPSFCPHCQCSDYPRCTYVAENLCGEITTLLQHHPPCNVLLSVLLQPNNLYHVNISLTSTGEPLGCIYATEQAINEAVEADVFKRFLTFFIVDARISMQQKDKILAHTFEFFKT